LHQHLRESRSQSHSRKKVNSPSHSRLGSEIFGSSGVPNGPLGRMCPNKHICTSDIFLEYERFGHHFNLLQENFLFSKKASHSCLVYCYQPLSTIMNRYQQHDTRLLSRYQKCEKEIKKGHACSNRPTVATLQTSTLAKMGQNCGKTDRHKYLIHKLL
jgi:hypothetical protein